MSLARWRDSTRAIRRLPTPAPSAGYWSGNCVFPTLFYVALFRWHPFPVRMLYLIKGRNIEKGWWSLPDGDRAWPDGARFPALWWPNGILLSASLCLVTSTDGISIIHLKRTFPPTLLCSVCLSEEILITHLNKTLTSTQLCSGIHPSKY